MLNAEQIKSMLKSILIPNYVEPKKLRETEIEKNARISLETFLERLDSFPSEGYVAIVVSEIQRVLEIAFNEGVLKYRPLSGSSDDKEEYYSCKFGRFAYRGIRGTGTPMAISLEIGSSITDSSFYMMFRVQFPYKVDAFGLKSAYHTGILWNLNGIYHYTNL